MQADTHKRSAARQTQDQAHTPDPEREMLRDWELEAQVLGALILDPALLAQAVADGVTEATFHRQRHALTLKALRSLTPEDHAAGGSVALIEALRRAGDHDLVGESTTGAAAISALLDAGFASGKSARWAWREKLLPLARAREAVRLHEGAARRIREQPDALAEIQAETARELGAIGAVPVSGRFGAAAVSAADLCAQEIPKPRSLLGDGVLAAGGFAIVYGKPGVGKTWLALALARALTRGEPWLGLATPGEGVRVGVLELELGAHSIQARLRALGLGTHPRDAGLQVVYRPNLRGAVDLCRAGDMAALREWARAVDVLMVDAFSRAHTASENKAEELGPVLAALDALRHETACAVVLFHHERKQGNDSGAEDDLDALRGHSRMQSDPTLLVRLKRTSGGLKCVVFVKVSEGSTPGPVYLRIGEDGCPEVVQAPEAARDRNRQRVLNAVLAAVRPVSRADVEKATGLSKSAAAGHLKALTDEGRIAKHGANRDAMYSAPTVRPSEPSEQRAPDGQSSMFDNSFEDSEAEPSASAPSGPSEPSGPSALKGGTVDGRSDSEGPASDGDRGRAEPDARGEPGTLVRIEREENACTHCGGRVLTWSGRRICARCHRRVGVDTLPAPLGGEPPVPPSPGRPRA